MSAPRKVSVALVGNPNVGKTSLFNALTGSRQHVGNWPGVTVEKKTGTAEHRDTTFSITDLPGTYSLTATSPDEAVARDFILDGRPDVVVQVADATNLERNLYLTTQLLETGLRVVLALNMSDQSSARGDRFDGSEFEALWGVPAVRTVAHRGEGIADLLDTVLRACSATAPTRVVDYGGEAEAAISRMEGLLEKDPGLRGSPSLRWMAVSLVEGDPAAAERLKGRAVQQEAEAFLEGLDRDAMSLAMVERRYSAAVRVLDATLRRGARRRTMSDSLDAVVTDKHFGIPIFLTLIWAVFQVTFIAAAPFSTMIDMAFVELAELVRENLRPDWLASLISDGMIGGVGFVLVFLPNILIMFLLLSFMEASGYLARAAFVMDRLMSSIGLHGKSFIPMLLGLGCNVPAIMATRTIEDRRSRLVTILTAPFISCSARLPVYILLAGAFFPQSAGTVVFAIYVLGIVVAVVSAKLFRSTILKGRSESFIMELPPYRLPNAKGTAIHMWDRGSQYLKKAGTVILLGAVAVWLLASLPWGVEYGGEDSLVGDLGRALEPLVAPLGLDWRIAVALFFGFVAKEVVVGALGVLYGAPEDGIGDAMIATGLEPAAALGLMVFVLVYTPCLATLGVMRSETGSWKWVAFSVLYGLVLAWLLAFVVFQLGSVLA